MSYEKYLMTRDIKEVKLDLPDEISVKVKPISWAKKNQIVSSATSYDDGGQMNFNIDLYFREVLKEIIIEAPWGKTDDMFLSRVNNEFGAALQKLVPEAFGEKADSPDQTKKESNGSSEEPETSQ